MKQLLIVALIIVLIESACIYCMKHGKANDSWQACALGIVGFVLVGFMFNIALDHGQLGSMAIVLEGLTILFAFIMGYIYFEEEWNTNKTIAIILSFIAIAIIYVEESKERGINIV